MTDIATQNQVSDKELISYLDTLGLTSKLSEAEKTAFLSISKAFGLNPFKREIHASKYGETFSIVTGYEVYLKRAERHGKLDGWTATTSGSVVKGDLKATVTIYRKDRTHPFIWEALYSECVQLTKDGNVTKFWKKAEFMTKKVAIAQAFRLCFPDELAGMPYTADEIQEEIQDIPHMEIKDEIQQIKISVLNQKQFNNLLKSDRETIKNHIDAIADGKLSVTPEQYNQIHAKYAEFVQQE